VPYLHDNSAAPSHQRGEVRDGAPALLRIEMHPDCGEHDDVKLLAARQQQGQIGQAVVQPLDARR